MNRDGGNVRKADGEASGSFLEKRTKKLLLLGDLARLVPPPPGAKFFCFFLFTKRRACFAECAFAGVT
jgi:hypothetical protein